MAFKPHVNNYRQILKVFSLPLKKLTSLTGYPKYNIYLHFILLKTAFSILAFFSPQNNPVIFVTPQQLTHIPIVYIETYAPEQNNSYEK